MSVLGGALVTLSTASLKHLYSQLLYKEVLCYYCFFIKGNTGDHTPCSMSYVDPTEEQRVGPMSSGTQLGTKQYDVPPNFPCKIQTFL